MTVRKALRQQIEQDLPKITTDNGYSITLVNFYNKIKSNVTHYPVAFYYIDDETREEFTVDGESLECLLNCIISIHYKVETDVNSEGLLTEKGEDIIEDIEKWLTNYNDLGLDLSQVEVQNITNLFPYRIQPVPDYDNNTGVVKIGFYVKYVS